MDTSAGGLNMKITHFSNSFISIDSQGDTILCDPWIGKANAGGWQSFPEYSIDELTRHLKDVKWVYLSHLHDDHFHAETLRSCKLLDREFIIKRFKSPILKNRLLQLGVTTIHEIDPFTLQKFGPFELSIFPQLSSNSSGLEDDVNYDLDTSISIKADGVTFFNQVDNPLSLQDINVVSQFIRENLGEIDVACTMSGAASEYPHLFLGIDHASEKRRIVDGALNDLVEWLKLLKPKFFFPAGGTYLIPGWMSIYNENIAQPTFSEIANFVEMAGLAVKTLPLEGGKCLEISCGQHSVKVGTSLLPIESDLNLAIKTHRSDEYQYACIKEPHPQKLQLMLNAASESWLSKVNEKNLKIHQSIRFEIYSPLYVVSGIPDKSKLVASYQLFNTQDSDVGDLIIHIDQRAIVGCITRNLVWNAVLGTLCFYERRPNHFYPTDFFSLNFFSLSSEKLEQFK